MNVIVIPGIEKVANKEGGLAEASDLLNVWVAPDPIRTDVLFTQGGRRLKRGVRCRERGVGQRLDHHPEVHGGLMHLQLEFDLDGGDPWQLL